MVKGTLYLLRSWCVSSQIIYLGMIQDNHLVFLCFWHSNFNSNYWYIWLLFYSQHLNPTKSGLTPSPQIKNFWCQPKPTVAYFRCSLVSTEFQILELPCSSKRRTVAPTPEQLENHFSNTTQQPALQRCYMQSKMMWTHPWPRALPKFLLWAL